MADAIKAKKNEQFKVVLGASFFNGGYSWCLTKLADGVAFYSQENVPAGGRYGAVDQIFTFIALGTGEKTLEFELLKKSDPEDKKESVKIAVEISDAADTGIGSDRFLDYGEALAVYKNPDSDLPIAGAYCPDGSAIVAYMPQPRSAMTGECATLYMPQPTSNVNGSCVTEYMAAPRSAMDCCRSDGSAIVAYMPQPRSAMGGGCTTDYMACQPSALDGSCNMAYRNEARSNMDGGCVTRYMPQPWSNMSGGCVTKYMPAPRSVLDGTVMPPYYAAPRAELAGGCSNMYRIDTQSNMTGDCAPMYYVRQCSELDGGCVTKYMPAPRSSLNGGVIGYYGNSACSGFRCDG